MKEQEQKALEELKEKEEELIRELENSKLASIAQVQDNYEQSQQQLAEQQAKALEQLEQQKAQAKRDIERQEEAELQEYYARLTLGRQAMDGEEINWEDLTVDQIQELSEHQALMERVTGQVKGMLQEAMQHFDYTSPFIESLAKQLNIRPEEIQIKDEPQIQALITYLENQDLHFGRSAVMPLLRLLENTTTTIDNDPEFRPTKAC